MFGLNLGNLSRSSEWSTELVSYMDFRKERENGGLMVVEWVYDGWLVVTGTWLDYDFPYIGNFIIPTDELIFFRGVGIPPNQEKS
jgi:hypothetical protein